MSGRGAKLKVYREDSDRVDGARRPAGRSNSCNPAIRLRTRRGLIASDGTPPVMDPAQERMAKGVPNKMVAERSFRPSRRGHFDTWSESTDEGEHVEGDSAEYVMGTDEDDRQSYSDDSPVVPRARLK